MSDRTPFATRRPIAAISRLAASLLLIAATSGLAWADASFGAPDDPRPQRIGELEPASIRTPTPYPVSYGDGAREWVVAWPDATYIRVHFSAFDLAEGDWVEVADPSGDVLFRYEGLGLHGDGDFWANTIPGDTAIVRMHAVTGGDSGFAIDAFGRGTEQIFFDQGDGNEPPSGAPGTDSVCGTNEWEDVECRAATEPYERARAVAKAVIGCCSSCTAWKISDSGQFMFNNHCTATQSGVESTELIFDYKNAACGGGGSGESGRVNGDTLVATGYTLDYTLMTTIGDSSSIPCLTLDPNPTVLGQRIYIAHHPSGGVKKLSIDSDQNEGGVCRVDDPTHTGRAAGSDVGYYCDTTNGSSGSPVLDWSTHFVVALHHFGGCLNSGGRSDLILDEIGSLIDSCSSGGGPPPTCGDGVRDAGEACDGTDFGGVTCGDFDCTGGGTLACNADCTFDTAQCLDCGFCGDATCGHGEDCSSCPSDCASTSAAACGNGVCEAADGEDCLSCPEDCNGVQTRKPAERFCCGAGGGENPVGCDDTRCGSSGFTCEPNPVYATCCGDATCDSDEDLATCALDCTADTPGEASPPTVDSMMQIDYDRASDTISLTYASACASDDHVIEYAELNRTNLETYAWEGQQCGLGTSGSYDWPQSGLPQSLFFVVVGQSAGMEGSYGVDSSGAERPDDATSASCPAEQDFLHRCD